jgi:NTE family protein
VKAYVLSGAGNFGAMQVGVMQVLFEAGFRPELVVGTSAGSLNAAFYAADPTWNGLARLADSWRQAPSLDMELPSWLRIAYRVWRDHGDLIDSRPVVRYLEENLPSGVSTFTDLRSMHGIRALAVAVNMETQGLRVFGDQDQDRIVDGLMSSIAVPPYLAPWQVGDQRYFDGGVLAKLPVLPAVERGATEIYALDVQFAMGSLEAGNGMLDIAGYALSLMIEQQTELALRGLELDRIDLKLIPLKAPTGIEFWDFRQADTLIRIGRSVAEEVMANLS